MKITKEFIDQSRERYKTLTPQQRRVALLITEGCSHREVARRMGLSPKTIDVFKAQVKSRLGVEDTHAIPLIVLAALGAVRAFEMKE